METVEVIDKLVRIAIFIARIKATSERDHFNRIRLAHRARKVIDAFIAEEVEASQSVGKSDPAYLTWDRIGEAVDISRSAAYTRYGKKKA